MKEEIEKLIQKAYRSLEATQNLCKAGNYEFAVSRAYYTMFYVAEALLLSKDMAFSKHSAVISGFNQHFVKDGEFPKEMYKTFIRAFQLRQKGDYLSSPNITKDEAEKLSIDSENFIKYGVAILQETKT